jgi:hypothetical protein
MVSVLVLKAVDCVFIGGIMVSMLVLKAVDHGFIAGVANHYATNEPTIYRFRDKYANPLPMNPRSTAFETSTLTIIDHGFIGGGLAFLSRKR